MSTRELFFWNRNSFGHLGKKIKKLQGDIQNTMKKPHTQENCDKLKRSKNDLIELLKREEILWRQRLRVHWLKEGDSNSKIFHQRATTRRKKNKISKLKDEQDIWRNNPEEIEQLRKPCFRWVPRNFRGRIVCQLYFSKNIAILWGMMSQTVLNFLNGETQECFCSKSLYYE